MYGKRDYNRPVDIHITKWSQNKNTFGSYSFYPFKAFSDCDFEDLDKPIPSLNGQNKVYFAGEAYDYKYSGYSHGAYLSGEKTAKKIIEN